MEEKRKQLMEEGSIEIDIATILRDIKALWRYILLTAVGTACIAFVLASIFRPLQYRVTTVLAVDGGGDTLVYDEKTATTVTNLNTTFINLLEDKVITNRVTEAIGSDQYTISSSQVEETNLVNLSVTATSPQLAFRAMRALLEVYPEVTNVMFTDLVVNTLQAPTVTSQPINSISGWLYAALGFAVGTFLMAGIIALFATLRNTVKNRKDMREKVDASLLGVIPILPVSRRVNKRRDFMINASRANAELAENYYIAASRLVARMEKKNAKVVLVTSSVPHEGKTTTTVNLAIAISRSQKKVLLIDADFRSPAVYKTAKIDKAKVPEEMRKPLSDALDAFRYTKNQLCRLRGTQVDILMNLSSDHHISQYIENGSFRAILEQGRKEYDYVLVDTGPVSLVSDTETMAQLCDATVLVIRQDVVPVPVINDIVDMLNGSVDRLAGAIYREMKPGRVTRHILHSRENGAASN